jgi:hypothetical protein
MVPDSVDLDYLRSKAAAYRRQAQAAPASPQAAWLLDLATRYETCINAFEPRPDDRKRRQAAARGRS